MICPRTKPCMEMTRHTKNAHMTIHTMNDVVLTLPGTLLKSTRRATTAMPIETNLENWWGGW